MELHRVLLIYVGDYTYANQIDKLKDKRYPVVDVCIETSSFGFDEDYQFFSRINGDYAILVTPGMKHGKLLSEFRAKSVTELVMKLELEGFLN